MDSLLCQTPPQVAGCQTLERGTKLRYLGPARFPEWELRVSGDDEQ